MRLSNFFAVTKVRKEHMSTFFTLCQTPAFMKKPINGFHKDNGYHEDVINFLNFTLYNFSFCVS